MRCLVACQWQAVGTLASVRDGEKLSRLRHTPITGCPAAPSEKRAQVMRSSSELGSNHLGQHSPEASKPLIIRLRNAVVFRDRHVR